MWLEAWNVWERPRVKQCIVARQYQNVGESPLPYVPLSGSGLSSTSTKRKHTKPSEKVDLIACVSVPSSARNGSPKSMVGPIGVDFFGRECFFTAPQVLILIGSSSSTHLALLIDPVRRGVVHDFLNDERNQCD